MATPGNRAAAGRCRLFLALLPLISGIIPQAALAQARLEVAAKAANDRTDALSRITRIGIERPLLWRFSPGLRKREVAERGPRPSEVSPIQPLLEVVMLRLMSAAALCLSIVGCISTAPFSLVQPSPRGAPDLFDCTLQQINRLEYVVLDANKDAGFIRAERKTSGGAGEVIWNRATHDQLTAAVYPETSGRASLRLTATTTSQKDHGDGAGQRTAQTTSTRAKQDVATVVAACSALAGTSNSPQATPSPSREATPPAHTAASPSREAFPPARTTAPAYETTLRQVRTTAASANVRAEPSTAAAILATVPRGTVLPLAGEQAGWYKVTLTAEITARANTGWLHGSVAELVPGSTATAIAAPPAAQGLEPSTTRQQQPTAATPAFGPQANPSILTYDPDEAYSRALRCPGCGHFYTGDNGRAALLAVSGIAGVGIFLYGVYELLLVPPEINCVTNGFDLDCDSNEHTGVKPMLFGTGIALTAWGIGMLDSRGSAERRNRAQYARVSAGLRRGQAVLMVSAGL